MTLGERVINLVTGGAYKSRMDSAAGAMREMIFGRSSMSLLQPRTRYDYASQVGNGLGSATIMAPVLWIARTFPEAPVVVYARTAGPDGYTDNAVDEHPMNDLLRHPNPFYSGSVLFFATMISWTIDGNAYWMKIRNGLGQVVQLWYVPHWMIKPIQDSATDYITNYRYMPGGRNLDIPTTEVVHLRYGLDPENPMKGYAPLKALFREVFTDDEAANYSASLLRNFGVPGIIAAPKDSNTPFLEEDAKTVKEKMKTQFTGDLRGEPMVLTLPIDVHKFSYSPAEMDMKVLREIPEERVCAVLGIPAAVVGFGSGLAQTKVGATMLQLERQAYKSNIIPTQRLIAEELDTQLLSEFEADIRSIYCRFDNSNISALQDDKDALYKRVVSAVQGGVMRRDEGRKMIGLSIDPEDAVYYVAQNLLEVPAGMSAEEIYAARPKPAAPALPGPEVPKRLPSPEVKISRRQAGLMRQMRADALHQAEEFAKDLRARFDRLGADAAAEYAKVSGKALVAVGANGNGRKAPPPFDDAIMPKPNFPHDTIAIHQILKAIDTKPLDYRPTYLRIADATIGAINAHLGVSLNLDDSVERAIVAGAGKRMGLVDLEDQSKDAMFKALEEGRALGEGADAMTRRIRDTVSAGPWSSSEVRSRVIARTETKYAQNISSIYACREGDGIVGMTMIDAQLGATDAECEDLNGQDVSFEEAEQLCNDEHPNGTRGCVPRMEDP